MNFLAHAYLSFGKPEILVGNMISDFVKGKRKYDYAQGIQKGIALHRSIDTFTDEHEATRQAKEYLKPAVGLYAGAFVDVVYDHFLANDASVFTDGSLQKHAADTYDVLSNYIDILPPVFKSMLPFMKSQNWLYNYKSMRGTQSSFGGVVRRAKYLDDSSDVFVLFERHYSPLQKCYNAFFPEIKVFVLRQPQHAEAF